MTKKKNFNAEKIAELDIAFQAEQTYINFDDETGIEREQPADDEYPVIDVDLVEPAEMPCEADDCTMTAEELEEGYRIFIEQEKARLQDVREEILSEEQQRAKEWLETAKLIEESGGLDMFNEIESDDTDAEQPEDVQETTKVKEAKQFMNNISILETLTNNGIFDGVSGVSDDDVKKAMSSSSEDNKAEDADQTDKQDTENVENINPNTKDNSSQGAEEKNTNETEVICDEKDTNDTKSESTIQGENNPKAEEQNSFADRIVNDDFSFMAGSKDAFGCGVVSTNPGFQKTQQPVNEDKNGQQPASGADNGNSPQNEPKEQEKQDKKNNETPPKIKRFGGKDWIFKAAFVVIGVYGLYMFMSRMGADSNSVQLQAEKKQTEKVAAAAPKKFDDVVQASREQAAKQHAAANAGAHGVFPIAETGAGAQQPQGRDNRQGGQQPQEFDNQLRPEAAKTDITQDPIYQQKMALKQQYIELMRQSYTSSPQVQGAWSNDNLNRQNNNSQNGFVGGQTGNDRVAALNQLAKQASEAAQQAQANIASGAAFKNNGGGGGSGGTVSSAINAITSALGGSSSQVGKEAFFNSGSSGKGYLNNTRTAKIAPYTLPAGTMIPAALISGINTDLPGNITASVTENVYDWQTANACLIPQGTRLFGTYSSSVSFGQKRVQISWQRLIYPDGSTISLEGMSGVDRRGYSGLKDKTYNHYGKMFMATVMTTAFTLLPALVENNRNNGNSVYYSNGTSFSETAASRAAEAIGRMGNKFFDKSLNTNPTIQVRPGKRFNVQVNADIPFYSAWCIMKR